MGAQDTLERRAKAHLFVGREAGQRSRFGVQFWNSDISASTRKQEQT
jgi:hypothetical protein